MYKCTNSVQPRKQGAIMKKVLTVFIAAILVALTAFWCVACDEKNGDASEGKLNIVFLGDSIAEALIGASPVSERDNYGYYALVGRTNGYNYYNHSMSGHLTSGNMANKAGEGLLEVISRETEKATLIRTHIAEADVIHISVLGNNILQYSLGSLMLEMADRLANIAPGSPESWYQSCFDREDDEQTRIALKEYYADDKSLFDYLHDGGTLDNVRPSIWSGDGETISFGDRFDGKNPYTIDPKFNFPPTYQNIVDIVAKLRELNPDAKIIFQKVYNPVYEGTTLITKWEYQALAEKGYDTIAKVRELAGHLLGYLNGMLDEYNEKNPDNTVYTLDIYKAFDDVTKSDVKDGVVDLSANSLGFNIEGLDLTDAKVKEAVKYVGDNMALPADLLDAIPQDTVLKLTLDTQYAIRDLTASDGTQFRAIYLGYKVKDNPQTAPFGIFTLKDNDASAYLSIEFMNIHIAIKTA